MVLFAFEEALGAYVVQNAHAPDAIPDGMRGEIERRASSTASVLPTTQLVQETYVTEVIDLAIATARGRSDVEPLNRLKQLVDHLGVFDVRNAVCHPNRPFPEHFWYRTAALATDPSIEALRLYRVIDAFRCAVDGRLMPPPDGWLEQRAWIIPNNLPSAFDHEVTGLIARKDEATELKKRLRNPRNTFLALVGPGGTGKTALCLETLRELALEPLTLDWTDEIVYVSAKTERLTAAGIELVADPLDSLASVKEAIGKALIGVDGDSNPGDQDNAFDIASARSANRRVLICVDNLETLLREHAETIEEFVQSLPTAWRVLVTSRVSVNGANVLTLGPIRPAGALKLGRDYLAIRGAQKLDELQLGRLVEVCDCNPLAIRLAVDSYAAGSELAVALAQTTDRIVEFSYTSLIDRLPSDAGKILEALFGSPDALNRSEFGHLLSMSPDQVAESVNSLLRTSLVTRDVTGPSESYSLSSSVRDLLLRAPRDPAVRADVQTRLREQHRVLADLERSGSRDFLAEDFVPSDAPPYVRALVARIKRSVVGRAGRAIQLSDLAEIRRALSFDAGEPVLHRAEALLLDKLNDRFAAIESLAKAVACGRDDAAARLLYAEALRDEQRLPEALEQTDRLLNARLAERPEVSVRNKVRLLRTHWVTALWLKRFDDVLAATADWRSAAELRPALAALRVSALQRQLDESPLAPEHRAQSVHSLLACLGDTFRLDGYLPDVVHEGFHALERLDRLARRRALSPPEVSACAAFLDGHLPAMCGNHRDYSLEDVGIVSMLKTFRDAAGDEPNPLREPRWSDLLSLGQLEDAALVNAGYQLARITRLFPAYLFARAMDGSRDFYVNKSATDLNDRDFGALRLGQLLQVLPGASAPESGRAMSARHAMLA